MDTWLATERYYRTRYKKYFFQFSSLGLSLTKPIRDTEPCRHPSTPSMRRKRRVESYRIFKRSYSACSHSPDHPLRVTEKATHGKLVGPYSWHSKKGTSFTINIVHQCEVCPRDHDKVVESLWEEKLKHIENIRTAGRISRKSCDFSALKTHFSNCLTAGIYYDDM